MSEPSSAARQAAEEVVERLFERMQFRSVAVYSEGWAAEIIATALDAYAGERVRELETEVREYREIFEMHKAVCEQARLRDPALVEETLRRARGAWKDLPPDPPSPDPALVEVVARALHAKYCEDCNHAVLPKVDLADARAAIAAIQAAGG